MNKHTAKTLAKYLGMEVWVEDDENGHYKGRLTQIDECGEMYVDIQDGPYYLGEVYPILKTVDDLTDSDIKVLKVASDLKDNSWPKNFNVPKTKFKESFYTFDAIYARYINTLLTINSGAIKDLHSPTGYFSVLDNLPCIRWREDGVYLL